MAQKTFVDPIKYVVGKDIPQDVYDKLLIGVTDWFAEKRDTKAPAALARQTLQECLDGTTKDGSKWFAMALTPFATRVRVKCQFDMDKMEPMRSTSEKNKAKKDKEKDKRQEKKRKAAEDGRIPDELRKEMRGSARYGDDANVFLSEAEQTRWTELQEAYVAEFPYLDSVNARAELRLLADMHVLMDRYRMKVLEGKGSEAAAMADVAERMEKIKKALGIHPDQVAKRTSEKTETSIGAAAATLDTSEFRSLRLRWFAEEMLLVYQMFMTPRADGLDYQLDEVGLFGLTKSRVVCCPKCGTKNFAGFSIDEIETWLVDNGHLKRLPPAPEPTLDRAPELPVASAPETA